MQNLINIIEKLKINSNSKIIDDHYHPTNKNELRSLIKELIKQRGNNGDLNDIDTSKITDMSHLFDNYYLKDFNGNISEWDVSNVENMEYMFNWCYDFKCNLNKWNVKKVKNMKNIFCNCPLEKNPPKWYKDE